MKTLYQYAIVRFLPHAQTGEVANVGIALCAPEQALFEFRLAPARFARVTDFFEDVDGKLYKTTINTVQTELNRVKDYAATVLPRELVAVMQELVRPRETLVRSFVLAQIFALYWWIKNLRQLPTSYLNNWSTAGSCHRGFNRSLSGTADGARHSGAAENRKADPF